MMEFPIHEPVLNDDNPKWLKVSQVIPAPKNKKEHDLMIKGELELEPELVFELEEPNQWRCTKCSAGCISESKPVTCTSCKRNADFEQITEGIMELWKLPRWKDIPVEDLDMQNTYLDLLELVKKLVIFQEEIQYKIYALWIISTYKAERWDTVPFLIFRGLISSGKTQALQVAGQLGYRLMVATGASFPAIVRASHEYNAGLLIDEIDNKIDKRTENGRAYIDFLKPSYKRGQHYFTADLNNQRKIQQYRNFGFKAFAGEKGGYDDAIFSRSIDFQMEQDYPEVANTKYVQDDIDRIQTILINYRYKMDDPPELGEKYELKGRAREVFECIIATAMHIGIDHTEILEHAKAIEKEKIEDFRNSQEWEVLKAIKEYENAETLLDAPEEMKFSDLVEKLNWQDMQRPGQKIGFILNKKFFLKTKRKRDGTVLLLNHNKNSKKLRYLYKRYDIK